MREERRGGKGAARLSAESACHSATPASDGRQLLLHLYCGPWPLVTTVLSDWYLAGYFPPQHLICACGGNPGPGWGWVSPVFPWFLLKTNPSSRCRHGASLSRSWVHADTCFFTQWVGVEGEKAGEKEGEGGEQCGLGRLRHPPHAQAHPRPNSALGGACSQHK